MGKGRTIEQWDELLTAKYGDMYKTLTLPAKYGDKARFMCKLHGEFSIMPSLLLGRHQGCAECVKLKPRKYKHDATSEYEKVVAIAYPITIEDFTSYYKGSRTLVKATCPVHGKFEQTLHRFTGKESRGCPKCGVERISAAHVVPFEEFVAKATEKHQGKYTYIRETWSGMSKPVKLICPEHGESEMVGDVHLRSKIGCLKCVYDACGERTVISFEDYVSRARSVHGHTYNYLSDGFDGMTSKVKIICRTHGVFETVGRNHIHSESGCPICAKIISRGELAIRDYVEKLGLDVIGNFKYEGRKEADVYVSSLNLALEYDGLPWHSTKYRTRERQLAKTLELKAKGIALVRIFEDEWENRQEQVKRLIAARLGKLDLEKVYARKCQFTEPTNDEAKEFYNQYHIQGWNRYGKHVALKYGGNLVAMMSFTKSTSHRGKTPGEGEWELARFATSHHVIGGASKLMKKFIADNGVTKLTSYSDNRLFTGGMYKALGFTEDGQVPPSYSYWKEGSRERLHKSKFRHSELPKILGSAYNPDLTERENCENNGYYQIYDDGLTRWILNLEKPT